MANHFALPGFESVFSISQDLLVCVHASLSQNGFHQEPLGRLDIIPLLISKDFSGREDFLDFQCETHVVSYLLSVQGPAMSLDFPAINILELLSTGNELKLLTSGGEGHLPPASRAQVRLL